MPAIEIGRICIKLAGREAGKKCVILDVLDKNYVLITGPKDLTSIRRRRVNIQHLEPIKQKIFIEKSASDSDIIAALEKEGLADFMKESIKLSTY
ncbi:MAG: 50S ribosomal protein L14e [Candidatus Lokiarchaeota archaeon]|nr:50S ribosomal protein L14e [Candidatus Lokiarchaeota archaeon]